MEKAIQSVGVIGLGYIGLPTACLLAKNGFEVLGCDVNQTVVDTINRGEVHIVEPDLDQEVLAVVKNGRLRAATKVTAADAYIISVPTPFMQGHRPDLRYIQSATDALAKVLKPGDLVVLESTSPVGATEKVAAWLAASRPDLNIPLGAERYSQPQIEQEQVYIAHCPERVLPGRIMIELVENDRIIGGIDKASGLVCEQFYQTFVKGGILLSDARTAEMSKLVENAYRDVNIAFANELSVIADKMDVDVWELIRLANRHPRVNILQPGPGVGGHCIAVDPWFIVDAAPDEAQLIAKARQINDAKPYYVLEQVKQALVERPGARVACLGLAYKPDIDDCRESPALWIAEQLAAYVPGGVLVVEPNLTSLPQSLQASAMQALGDKTDAAQVEAELVALDTALASADILVLLVNHQPFYRIDPSQVAGKCVIDTRGVLPRA
jgi:UDP-N-acetyl-D-mannosaminuronic acid dehydrogenase